MKLLLVHANDSVASIYQSKLEQEGYEVIRARSGAEGREKVVAEDPKIIVTDFDLPDMTGREFLRGITITEDHELSEKAMRIVRVGVGNFNYDNSFHTDDYLGGQQTPDELIEKILELKKIKIKYYPELEEIFV